MSTSQPMVVGIHCNDKQVMGTIACILFRYKFEPVDIEIENATFNMFGWNTNNNDVLENKVDDYWTLKLGQEITPLGMVEKMKSLLQEHIHPEIGEFIIENHIQSNTFGPRVVLMDCTSEAQHAMLARLGGRLVVVTSKTEKLADLNLSFPKRNIVHLRDDWSRADIDLKLVQELRLASRSVEVVFVDKRGALDEVAQLKTHSPFDPHMNMMSFSKHMEFKFGAWTTLVNSKGQVVQLQNMMEVKELRNALGESMQLVLL